MSTPISLDRKVTPMCPKCGSRMHLIDGKHGQFWGCNCYPDCSGRISTRSNGRTGSSRKISKWSDDHEDGGTAVEAFVDAYFGGGDGLHPY